MSNLLVQYHRRTNPDTQLSDDEITLKYANENVSNIQSLLDYDPLFADDFKRLIGGSREQEEQGELQVSRGSGLLVQVGQLD